MIGSLHRYTGLEICKLWAEAVRRDIQMRASDQDGMALFEREFAAAKAGISGTEMAQAWARDFGLVKVFFRGRVWYE